MWQIFQTGVRYCDQSPVCLPHTPNCAGSPTSAGCFLFLSDSDFDPDTSNLLQLGPSAVLPGRVSCLFVVGPSAKLSSAFRALEVLALLVQTQVDTWTAALIGRNGMVILKFSIHVGCWNTLDCMNAI